MADLEVEAMVMKDRHADRSTAVMERTVIMEMIQVNHGPSLSLSEN